MIRLLRPPALPGPVLPSVRAQRGAAALIVTMTLFFVMVLMALFVNRNLVFEQRSSASQYRSTQAFEAAEAGLEWAQAQLNANQRIGVDCEPVNTPAGNSFRSRYLNIDAATTAISPVTWLQNGVATPLQPSCVGSTTGWSCSCPSSGLPVLTVPPGTTPAPAFTLRFLPGDKPGLVRLSATGCSSLGSPCRPGSVSNADATAQVQVLLGRVSALRTPPVAALTARGEVNAGTAMIGLHNPDPATGVAVRAGGQISAPHVRLSRPAGASLASGLAPNDAGLAASGADRFFASHFGLDQAAWKNQPAVTRIRCRADCSTQIAAAVGAAADAALLWVEGDLALTGPLALGSLAKPVLIVAGGSVQIEGAVAVYGVVYGSTLGWNGAGNGPGSGAFLRGAALTESDYTGNGAPDLFYDPAVLAHLSGASGSFVRVSGSWRDF